MKDGKGSGKDNVPDPLEETRSFGGERFCHQAEVPERFQVVRPLGCGAYGEVYLAKDQFLERDVCVKLLRTERFSKEELVTLRERFLREARAAAKLKHPNIVAVFDAMELGENLAIVMEYVEGETLRDLIRREKKLPLDKALDITVQVATALRYAHGMGVIHRDVKPANIFISPDGTIKLGDFGMAKIEGDSTLTSSGAVVGTPAYMSPEQLRGQPVDGRSDVFSIGCLLYEMLSGRKPFDSPSIVILVYQILHEKPDALSAVVPVIPPNLDAVIVLALEKDPRQRYQSVDALVKDLEEYSRARVDPPKRKFLWLKKWRWCFLALFLAVAGVIAFRLARSPSTDKVFLSILPFQNETGVPEYSFISAGLGSELFRNLSREGRMVLIPSQDVQELLRRGEEKQTATRKAGASFLVQGSLLKQGGSCYLQYCLVNVVSGKQFSDRLPLDLKNLPMALNQMSNQTVTWLGLPPGAGMTKVDPGAFELYLRGMSKIEEMREGSPAAFAEAKALLERSLQTAPSIEAYFGLARLHYQAVDIGIRYDRDTLEFSRFYLEKGLALQPDYLPLMQLKIDYLMQTGRQHEALKLIAQELMQDRLAPGLLTPAASCLRNNGNYSRSEEFYRYALHLFPENWVNKLNLSRCLFQAGRVREALDLLRSLQNEYPSAYWIRLDYARVCLQVGRTAESERIARELPDIVPTRLIRYQIDHCLGKTQAFLPGEKEKDAGEIDWDMSLILAENYALSGDMLTSLHYLKKTLENGWTAWNYFDADPMLANLRVTEGYQKLRTEGVKQQQSIRVMEEAAVGPVRKKLGMGASSP